MEKFMFKIMVCLIYFLQTFTMLISFIFSLRVLGKKNISSAVKRFYWYNFIAFLISTFPLLTLYFDKDQQLPSLINSISVWFHFYFLVFFIYKALPNGIRASYFKILLLFFFASIFYFQYKVDIYNRSNAAFSISNFGLILFCFIYFFQILMATPNLILSKDATFWIIVGVFFLSGLLLPSAYVVDYLMPHPKGVDFIIILSASIMPFIVFHIFLIKGFVCAIQQHKA